MIVLLYTVYSVRSIGSLLDTRMQKKTVFIEEEEMSK